MPLIQQLLVQLLKTALHVTLDGMELQAGHIHSARAIVLLVVTRWRILLLVQLLKTALHVTLDGMELQAGQIHSARALVLLVVTRWRILLLVQVLKTALLAQPGGSLLLLQMCIV